jgi:predicted sulfurtransferase
VTKPKQSLLSFALLQNPLHKRLKMEVNSSTRNTDNKKFQVILFYKYHPLSKDRELVALYRSALEYFCASLDLKGRILVGCNEHQSEGINGTLSGSQHQVNVFVAAMTHFQEDDYSAVDILDTHSREAIQRFWNSSEEFYQKANCEPLVMTQSEFKWSTSNQADLFPDLNIKLVNELIGTGGVLASIPLEEIHQGYLTPAEWHQRISQLEDEKDSLLIDCRNIKECQIGNFKGALDPNTTTVSFSSCCWTYCSFSIYRLVLVTNLNVLYSLINFQPGFNSILSRWRTRIF